MASEGPLPRGWEVRRDPRTGWPYYINHNTGTTSWEPPRHRPGAAKQDMPYQGYPSNYWYPTGHQATPYPNNYPQVMDHQMPSQATPNGSYPPAHSATSQPPVQGNVWYSQGPGNNLPQSPSQQVYPQQATLPQTPTNGHTPSAQWAHSPAGPPSQGQTPGHSVYPAPGQREPYEQDPGYPVNVQQYHYPNTSPGGSQGAMYPSQHQHQHQPVPTSQTPAWASSAPAYLPSGRPLPHEQWPGAQSAQPSAPSPGDTYTQGLPSAPPASWARLSSTSGYEHKDVPYAPNHQDPRIPINNTNFAVGGQQQPTAYVPGPQLNHLPNPGPGSGAGQRVEYSAPPEMYKIQGGKRADRGPGMEVPEPAHPGHLKVERILCNVRELDMEVERFEGKRGDKRYRLLEELLTKQLLEADSVETNGEESVRQARKEAVHRIQGTLERLERIAC
eukprot:gi/632983013/ref/XP_007908438.1/ PREDICTED: BAG family molecular chaperone regulator 4 [Callorhinchus milii]